jgi:hypothetical protein
MKITIFEIFFLTQRNSESPPKEKYEKSKKDSTKEVKSSGKHHKKVIKISVINWNIFPLKNFHIQHMELILFL